MQRCPACPKCNSFFTTAHRENTRFKTSKQPLLLSCGHTFCESCILKFSREDKIAITCPECKVMTNVPEDIPILKSLTPNYFIIGMLFCNQRTIVDQELNRLIPAGASTTLHRSLHKKYGDKLVCQECNINKATCRCVKCDCFLCGLCFTKVHSKYKSLRQHQALELSDDMESADIKEMSHVCKDHENRPIEYFCEDDLTPICSRCVIMGAHKGHSISSMEDKNKALLADMEPALQTANYVVKKLRKTEQSFIDYSPNFKTETYAVTEEIRLHFQSLHGAMQAREQNLIKQVYEKFNNAVLPVLYKKADLNEEKRCLESSIKAAQRILNNNNETVLNAKEIVDQLSKARQIPCILVKQVPEPTDAIRWNSGASIDGIISHYGAIDGCVPTRFNLQTIGEVDTDDTETLSTNSRSSYTEPYNSGDDVIIEDESDEKNVVKSIFTEKQSYRAKYPGHCEQVYVTHIKNPVCFFCQKKTDRGKLNNLSKNMNIWCQSLSKEDDVPKHVEEGDLVLALYSADKRWYRARVKHVIPAVHNSEKLAESSSEKDTCGSTTQDSEASSITEENTNKVKLKKKKKDKLQRNEEQAEVLFFDYGNTEVLPFSRMRNMQQRFLKLPSLMLECALHDVEANNESGIWSKEAATTFKNITDGRVMFMNVIREINGILQVDLHKPAHNDIMDDRPISLRDSLIFLEFACFSYNSDPIDVKPVLPTPARSYTTPEPKTETEVFDVLVTSPETPFNFFVQPLGDESLYLSTMMAEMQQTYSVDSGDLYTVYCPQQDMICVAQYTSDEQWYRARVLHLPGRKLVDVQYVDYGYVDRIPYWNLRKILDTFLVLPPQAVFCKLCDVEPVDVKFGWTQEALSWWSENVLFKKFQLKITGIPQDKFSVVLTPLNENNEPSTTSVNINSELVNGGFAVSTGVWSLVKPSREKYESRFIEKENIKDIIKQTASPSISPPSSSEHTPKQTSPEITPMNSPVPSPTKRLTATQPHLHLKAAPSSPKVGQNVAKKITENVQKAVEQSSSSETKSGENNLVIVSSYISPTNFHVQLVRSINKLNHMMKQLQIDGESEKHVTNEWKEQEYCIAKHSVDQLWYRVKILKVLQPNLYEVYLVDYGNTDHVTCDNIRTLKNKIRIEHECFAVRCHLALICPAGSTDRSKWSQTAREFMQNEIKVKTCYFNTKGGVVEDLGLPIDILLEEDVPETALEPARKIFSSMREQILEHGLAIPIKISPSRTLQTTSCGEYIPHPLPEDEDIRVLLTYVDYEGGIYAQLIEEEERLNSLTERIQSRNGLSELLVCDWQLHQPCLACFDEDECWYRGKIMAMEEKRIMVLYVDFGNFHWQTYTSIRAIHPDMLVEPLYALVVFLYQVIPVSEDGKWPVIVLDNIHSTIVNSEVHILHKQAVTENHQLQVTITLPNGSDLSQKLVTMGAVKIYSEMTEHYENSNKIAKLLQEPIPFRALEPFSCDIKFPVVVTHVELPNLVYCQHRPLQVNTGSEEYCKEVSRINTHLEELTTLCFNLNNSAPQSSTWSFFPKPGNVCSAQYSLDDAWYRGLVIEADEDTRLVYVFFVDYGNTEHVPLDRIRVLPKKLQKLPMQAMRCYIADLIPPAGHSAFSIKCLKLIPESLSTGNQEFLIHIQALSPLTINLYLKKINGDGLQLAHQTIVDQGFAQFEKSSKLFDLAVTRETVEDTPDVICEHSDEDFN